MFNFFSNRFLNHIYSIRSISKKLISSSFDQNLKVQPLLIMNKKKIANKTPSNLSAKVQVSILGNGALGNPASIIVNTDTDTYLINCGEGVQRLFYQHRIRISKIKDVFLTRASHSNYAGIFGMFLTYDSYFNERGCVPKLYTPSAMKNIAEIYSPFIGLVKNFQYNFLGINETEMKNGDVIENLKSEILLENVDMTIKSIKINQSSKSGNDDFSVAYLFLISDKPGQLNIEQCKKFKIPPGPLFSKLKSGQVIEINDQVIKPTDVMGPAEMGGAFIILECPTIDSIQSLIKNDNFLEHLESKKLQFILHITPEDVFNEDTYQKWLNSFDKETKHFILNASNLSELSLNDSSKFQIKLNQIDSDIFPYLKENKLNDCSFETQIVKDIPTMLTFNLRPEKRGKIEVSEENYLIDFESIINDLKEIENFKVQVDDYKNSFVEQQNTETFEQNILFLGTGSSIPGKLRNTSAIILNIKPNVSAFLDCGEATFMQLCRFYGRERYQEILKSVSLMFISHLHADHHFGMLRILQEISKITPETDKKTILLIAPVEIYTFLKNFRLDNILIEFQPSSSFVHGRDYELPKKFLEQQKSLGIKKIATVSVPHSYQSHGIVVDLGDEKTIAYSGDSQFSNSFDEIAKKCLLMIHEATMDDDLREEADLKRHSTISDAIQVARNCEAKYTILTHFSQRYAKIPVVNLQNDPELNRYIRDNVGIAFDFMNIKLDHLEKASKMKTALETLFANDLQDLHDKQMKKALKRKLIEGEMAILIGNKN